jgi:hypothetical protein
MGYSILETDAGTSVYFFLLATRDRHEPRKSKAQNLRWGAELPIEVDLVGPSLSRVEREKARTRVQHARGTGKEWAGGCGHSKSKKKKLCVGVLVEQVESQEEYSRRNG